MQIFVNMISGILVIILNVVFNLYITPLYIRNLGMDAYGYIGVITNFISFLAVVTWVLNSMVGRFYSFSFNQGKKTEANSYISTAFYTGIGFDLFLLPIIVATACNLENFLVISPMYLGDVKIAFILTAVAFLMSVISMINSTGAYALNRLDIGNNIRLLVIIIRFIIITLLFWLFQAKVYFLGISLIVENLFSVIANYMAFKLLVPDVKLNFGLFSVHRMKELVGSGFFNAIIQLGELLMSQVLLIVANHIITAYEVGVLSSIIVIINGLKSIGAAISAAFSPETLRLYATNRFLELIENTKIAVHAIGAVVGWCSTVFCIMYYQFFSLWLHKDFSEYHLAIVFFILPMISILATGQFHVILQAMNRLHTYSFITIICGGFSILVMYFLGKYMGWGMIGLIVGCNLVSFIQYVFILPLFVHKYFAYPIRSVYLNLLIIQIYSIFFFLLIGYITPSFFFNRFS